VAPLNHIPAPDGVPPANGYSHVVVGTGRIVAISGQTALDAQGELVGRDDPAAQARQVFETLRRCLDAVGASFEDVLKFTFFVTDVAFLPAIRQARDEAINTAKPPASSAVQVSALFLPGLLIEIEALAVLPAE
jgi:enamine deaminase RidA (YjgF/YER057c/UK114 family)